MGFTHGYIVFATIFFEDYFPQCIIELPLLKIKFSCLWVYFWTSILSHLYLSVLPLILSTFNYGIFFSFFFFNISSFYLNSNLLTYGIISISGVEFSDSSLTYNTQGSSQVPSLIPITHLAHSPTHIPSSNPHNYSIFIICLGICRASPITLIFFFKDVLDFFYPLYFTQILVFAFKFLRK